MKEINSKEIDCDNFKNALKQSINLIEQYKQYGCPNCGCESCDFAYTISEHLVTTTCNECHEKFVVLDIDKLSTKCKDIRPENNIGDFCYPRPIGYDLACFVNSKEAGQRICDVFNNLDSEQFSCHLDYRDFEPNWVQVKISFKESLRGSILSDLIIQNNNIITEDIIKEATSKKIDFKVLWRHQVLTRLSYVTSPYLLHLSCMNPDELSNNENDILFSSFYNEKNQNYLVQFETYGATQQIEKELKKGNVKNALSTGKHLLQIESSTFNKYYDFLIAAKTQQESVRHYFYSPLLMNINNQFINDEDFDQVIKDDDELFVYNKKRTTLNDQEQAPELIKKWDEILELFKEFIDLQTLQNLTNCNGSKTDEELNAIIKTQETSKNIFITFSLFGLYIQVTREIDTLNFENAVLAIQHVADQKDSPLFLETLNNLSEEDANKLNEIYTKLSDIVNIYCIKEETKQFIKEN